MRVRKTDIEISSETLSNKREWDSNKSHSIETLLEKMQMKKTPFEKMQMRLY